MENRNLKITTFKNILISKFHNLNIIKHGTFTLKNGDTSSLYIDFRLLVSYPQIFSYLNYLAKLIYPELFRYSKTRKIIPIPFGGIPFGTYLSQQNRIPALMVRDKPKSHGTCNIIEGTFTPRSDEFLIVEDVITSGSSIVETFENLLKYDIPELNLKNILCICLRNPNLKTVDIYNGSLKVPIKPLFTLNDITDYFTKLNYNQAIQFFPYSDNSFNGANNLYTIAVKKKSNLIVSCDFMKPSQIVELVQRTGEYIVAVKLHLDTLIFANDAINYDTFCRAMLNLSEEKSFIIIEDAKMADIESIMIEKQQGDQLAIGDFADAITIHAIGGLSILDKYEASVQTMIVVSEMSSYDNMIDAKYSQKIIDKLRDINKKMQVTNLLGLVCQNNVPKMLSPFEILTMSPGINLEVSGDGANQKYKVPDINNDETRVGMFWIVGRGITKCDSIEKQIENTKKYNKEGWNYFIEY